METLHHIKPLIQGKIEREKNMKGKKGTREGEGLNEWVEKEEKKNRKGRGDEGVTGEREREELIGPNKILVLLLLLLVFFTFIFFFIFFNNWATVQFYL